MHNAVNLINSSACEIISVERRVAQVEFPNGNYYFRKLMCIVHHLSSWFDDTCKLMHVTSQIRVRFDIWQGNLGEMFLHENGIILTDVKSFKF